MVFAHAEACLQQIRDEGGHAQIDDLGDVDHLGSALASIPSVRAWFSQLAAV